MREVLVSLPSGAGVVRTEHGLLVTGDVASGAEELYADGLDLKEPALTLPLYAHFPGNLGAGRRIGEPTEMADLARTALAALGLPVQADDAKKIEGEATCAKCNLHLTDSCQTAITVTSADGKKEVILADKNDVAKAFHKEVCQSTEKVTAEGVVTEKDGKKTIALTKIEAAK